MQQIEILHKKNRLFYISYITTLLLHCLTILLNFFDLHTHFLFIITVISILLGFPVFFKWRARVTQIILILWINLVLVYLIWTSLYVLNLFWLLFYLGFVTIYQSQKLNIITTLLILIELIFVIFYHPYRDEFYNLTDIIYFYTFFIGLLFLVVLIQTFYISRLWRSTEKKNIKKEHDLLSKESYLRLFFEYANDAIAVFDLNNRIIEINPAFEKLYGWTREECIGQSIPLVPPKHFAASQERFQRLLKGESFTLYDTQDMRKDGTIFDAQISLSPIFNQHNEIFALSVISRDISYVKENERLLLNAEKLKLAGEIAAGVAHEIRNPMTVISGFIQMMNADESSVYKDYTQLIETEIERIDLIISEFLVLSKPQANSYAPLHINMILQEVMALFQLEFQTRHITIDSHFSTEDTTIYGNKNQIKQVFINIIKNAIEAIDHDGQITFTTEVDDGFAILTIKDNGIGIPQHIMDHIFEPFYTTKTKGTGLGMMITNKIIQDHHGEIKVFSKEKIGTKITIRFPLHH